MTAFAFVFPGQGSQSVGMLDAWGDHPAVRDTLAEASDALGEDIGRLIASGPKEQLDLTTNTQPVMLTAGIACLRAWLADTGLRADGGGRTLTWRIQRARGRWLVVAGRRVAAGEAARPCHAGGGTGGCRCNGGDPRTRRRRGARRLHRSSDSTGEVVEAANYNDPKQTVIAGTKAGVAAACELLKTRGAKRALAVGGVGAVPFQADAAGRRTAEGASVRASRCASATDRIDQQHRRRDRDHGRTDSRRLVPAGVRTGALGRDRAVDAHARAWRW